MSNRHWLGWLWGWITLIGVILAGGQAAAEQPLVVEDDWGNQVSLPQPAQRIVALAPHIVENLYAVGAGEQLVAAVEYSDFPPPAQQLPRIGRFDSFDREAILALAPDLVIAWGSGNGTAIIEQLRQWEVPVFVSEPRDLEHIAVTLERFARLTGRQQAGQAVARQFRAELERLRQTRVPPVGVFYQLWHRPMQTVNADHVISDVIALCGGRNVFAAAPNLAPVVNREAVLAADPEVIIASGQGAERPVWLDGWQEWPATRAVQDDLLFHIHPDLLQRHTPRILQGARRVCEFVARAR